MYGEEQGLLRGLWV